MCQRPFAAEESAKHLTKRKLHTTHVGTEGWELLCHANVCYYAMLTAIHAMLTAGHDCHSPGMAVRMRQVLARPWVGVRLSLTSKFALSFKRTIFTPVMKTITIMIMIMTTMFEIQNPNTGLKNLRKIIIIIKVNYNYHKISQNPLRQFFKKLYKFDNFIRRRPSDHNTITFAIKYFLMAHLR